MAEIDRQIEKLLQTDDAAIEAALQDASIPTLMMCMVHLTGDTTILDGAIRPQGVYINEYQGYMSEEDKAAIRVQALQVLKDFKATGGVLPPMPDADTIHRMMNFYVAQEVPVDYVPMLLEEMELDGQDQRSDSWGEAVDQKAVAGFKAVIIGAGMSGILAGIRLKEAGIDFEIIEKNPGVGGTWFENRYPGARVDVGNHLYCYSFEPAYHWSEYFSQQPELQAYFERCIDKYGIREHIRFDTKVSAANYDDDEQRWSVILQNPEGGEESVFANILVSATGQLNRPRLPDIDGRESFQGLSCHSADWDPAVDCKGKKVIVIGAGASSFQLVPELAKEAQSLTVFQRSAPWMFENPIYHDKVSDGKSWCLENIPFYARWFRFLLFWPACDGAWETTIVDPDWPHQDRSINETNEMIRVMFTDYITAQVGDDKELLNKVIPDYVPLGKRTLQDNGSWLGALKLAHVDLNVDGIASINEAGVVSSTGEHFDADIIIYATGFQTDKFLWPMDISGRNGAVLSEQWGDEPSAYLGITVPNFPNFFCLFGPSTNLAFGGSLIFNGECQVRYMMECLKLLMQSGAKDMDCKPAVLDDYNQRLRAQHAKMIWEHESIKSSFYRNSEGKVTLLWPWKILDMWQWTKEVTPQDYTLK